MSHGVERGLYLTNNTHHIVGTVERLYRHRLSDVWLYMEV